MGLSKTEVNLRRLLAAAPQQQNQAKLVHYVATLREQLEQLGAETTPEGLPRISKAKVNDYSEKIEALAAKLASPLSEELESVDAVDAIQVEKNASTTKEETQVLPSPVLRKRLVSHAKLDDITKETTDTDSSAPVKLDTVTQAHIEKHRKLQEDLTDEMVGLARQLKDSSLLMHQSLKETEKLLDSTETAVEHSLASTGHANVRAVEIYSNSSKTSCFTLVAALIAIWLFLMVVILIRGT
ncbi:hypothetical protein Syun_022668 [Stephania yunnanensis]|uniref:USE1-like protein n=1 Tax=Stephania yunnanensis TaxID=152371 RepID=A0AAP0FA37_9MAGN